MKRAALIVLLAVATASSVALLLPDPIGSAGIASWVRALLPIVLVGGMVLHANQAARRGDQFAVNALLSWATVAAGFIGMIASLGG